MIDRISRNFSVSKYSDAKLEVYVQQILEKMTGNSYFPDPNPPLVDINQALTVFGSSVKLQVRGNKEDTVIKNRNRVSMVTLLKKLIVYVEGVANGDRAILLSSGFELIKERSVVGELDVILQLVVTVGSKRGTLLVKFEKIEHSRYYEIQYCEAPFTETSLIQSKTVTKISNLIEDLVSGREYSVRVAAAASNDIRNWSKWVSSYVI